MSNDEKMTRMRIMSKLYDYCYINTKKNLSVLDNHIEPILCNKKAILDIGCGSKPFFQYLRKKSKKIIKSEKILNFLTSMPAGYTFVFKKL